MPSKNELSYIVINDQYAARPAMGDPSIGRTEQNAADYEQRLQAFQNSMIQYLETHAVDRDLDIFSLTPGREEEKVLLQLAAPEKNAELAPGYWDYLYREAHNGTLMVRQPGEPYPRAITLGENGTDISVSEKMIGGIQNDLPEPERPGLFARFLHSLFDYETADMRKYLEYQQIKEDVQKTRNFLEKYAAKLEKDGTLTEEKEPKEERYQKKQQMEKEKQLEKKGFAKSIREIDTLFNAVDKHRGNVNALPEELGSPAANGMDPEFRAAMAMLLAAGGPVPARDGKGYDNALPTFYGLYDWMAKGNVKEKPENVDLADYQTGLALVDAGFGDPEASRETQVDLLAKALIAGEALCSTLVQNNRGIDPPFFDALGNVNRVLMMLNREENRELREQVFEKVGDKKINLLLGCQELGAAYLQGKTRQKELMLNAHEELEYMSQEDVAERKDQIFSVLTGTQAEILLKPTGTLKGVRSVGKQSREGGSFREDMKDIYNDSKRLDFYARQKSTAVPAALLRRHDSRVQIHDTVMKEVRQDRIKGIAESQQPKPEYSYQRQSQGGERTSQVSGGGAKPPENGGIQPG